MSFDIFKSYRPIWPCDIPRALYWSLLGHSKHSAIKLKQGNSYNLNPKCQENTIPLKNGNRKYKYSFLNICN